MICYLIELQLLKTWKKALDIIRHTVVPTIVTWKVAEILEKTFTNTRNESHTIKYKVFAA